ncbi:MAG: hypothetical protein Q8L69_15970, partial [Gallionellaceae bacterium]|nr:hypothetical protein [Gallionellaceae bacterium]
MAAPNRLAGEYSGLSAEPRISPSKPINVPSERSINRLKKRREVALAENTLKRFHHKYPVDG